MEFEWDLSIDHVSVYDDKYKKTFTLTEDGDFIFTQDGYTAEYDWLDFDHICFWEPKLFKPGIIAFYNDEDDDEPEIAIQVPRKYKNEFYMIFNILEENGLDVRAY